MLKLENVTKYYHSQTSVTCALKKINLELTVGEFVAITGESGSGKTTLLNIISGLDSYEDGEMYYDDKKTSYFDDEDWEKYRKEEIAFIFQNYNLIDSYTVLENVIVAYLIDGVSYNDAKVKALETLKLVGLDTDIHKKAIKLSGGQKQRLAIARALAKETKIIVADEPTGNLDAENGVAILKLLKDLSKDKLVIVVTHNQGQVEPFVTRKIRLHDGEIALDEFVEEPQVVVNDTIKENNKINNFTFTMMNIKSQPKKVFLLMLLIFIATFSTFIFIGNFKANLNDNKTKILDDSFFYNFDDTRLIVRNNDSSVITSEDLKKAQIENVVSVEKYDNITDINYYRTSDYKIKYGGGYLDQPDGSISFVDSSSIILIDETHFMRSGSSLTEDMLSYGNLPTGDFEMVVYSNDQSLLNTTEQVLFKNARKWGVDSWLQYEVKIVGLLKEPTEQAYFSDDICKILELSSNDLNIYVGYRENNSKYYTRWKNLVFSKVTIDPTLTGREVSFGESQKNILEKSEYTNTIAYKLSNEYVYNECSFNLNKVLSVSSTEDAIGLSKEMFEEFYALFKDKTQFAIFISDYAYTNDVQKALIGLNFDSISCYNSSVTGYDSSKVLIRYVNLIASIVALIVINLVTILLGLSILKVKKNDYVILKMIGLSNNDSKKINYYELLIYSLISICLTVVITIIIKQFVNIDIIQEMFKYIRIVDYLVVGLISIITTMLLGKSFGKFLTTKVKVTTLKEE